jgi:hypothetical protein
MSDFSHSPCKDGATCRRSGAASEPPAAQPAGPEPSDAPVTWCLKPEPGAHQACCPLLQALFITARALPVATTTTVVSTMNMALIGDLVSPVPQR